MPPHLAWQYPVLRLIVERVANLEEIRRSWNISQVMDVNELLDLREEAELNAAEASRDASEAARS